MTKQELELWLCGPDGMDLPLATLADAVGLPASFLTDTVLTRLPDRRRTLRFALAVLRDVYADDVEVRRWLRTPHAELGGRYAIDLIAAGRLREVDDLLLRIWHRRTAVAPARRSTRALIAGRRRRESVTP